MDKEDFNITQSLQKILEHDLRLMEENIKQDPTYQVDEKHLKHYRDLYHIQQQKEAMDAWSEFNKHDTELLTELLEEIQNVRTKEVKAVNQNKKKPTVRKAGKPSSKVVGGSG